MAAPTPRPAVGAVVLDDGGRLLVVLRSNPPAAGRWSLPGGSVEPGEGVRDAVRREVAEETGLEVAVGDLVGFVEVRDDRHHYVILDFAARVLGGELRAGDDAREVAWMTRSELDAAGATDDLPEYLAEHGVDLAP